MSNAYNDDSDTTVLDRPTLHDAMDPERLAPKDDQNSLMEDRTTDHDPETINRNRQAIDDLSRKVEQLISSSSGRVPPELKDAQQALSSADPKTITQTQITSISTDVRAAEGEELREDMGQALTGIIIPMGILKTIREHGHLNLTGADLFVSTHHGTAITREKMREREEAIGNQRILKD